MLTKKSYEYCITVIGNDKRRKILEQSESNKWIYLKYLNITIHLKKIHFIVVLPNFLKHQGTHNEYNNYFTVIHGQCIVLNKPIV